MAIQNDIMTILIGNDVCNIYSLYSPDIFSPCHDKACACQYNNAEVRNS